MTFCCNMTLRSCWMLSTMLNFHPFMSHNSTCREYEHESEFQAEIWHESQLTDELWPRSIFQSSFTTCVTIQRKVMTRGSQFMQVKIQRGISTLITIQCNCNRVIIQRGIIKKGVKIQRDYDLSSLPNHGSIHLPSNTSNMHRSGDLVYDRQREYLDKQNQILGIKIADNINIIIKIYHEHLTLKYWSRVAQPESQFNDQFKTFYSLVQIFP